MKEIIHKQHMEIPVALTVTGGTSVTFSDGTLISEDFGLTWELNFKFHSLVSSGSRSGFTFAISNVVFKNSGNYQACYGWFAGGGVQINYCMAQDNTNQILINHIVATTTSYTISGTVKLESQTLI